jgi:phage terminase large subunit-like protein
MRGYEKYIKDVQEGKIKTCLYIKQLVQRFEDFRHRPDIYFDAKCVDEAIDFLYQMKHSVGKSAGKNFELLPWQEFFFATLMGLKWKDTGLRVVKEVYLECARKQGKSSIIAALALYHMIMDGEAGPSVACLASTRDQARLIFEMITNYAKSIDPKSKFLKYYRNYIKMDANNGECKVFSSDASKLDGLNISLGIVDEYAVQPNNELYNKIKTSMGFRESPLMVCLTTPQGNLNSPAHKVYEVAIEILAGVKQQDEFWPFLYTLDTDDAWDDEDNWIKSNPSMGQTVTMDFLRSEANAAKNDTSKLVAFKTLYAGVWCQSMTTWIQQEIVASRMKETIDIEEFRGYPCVIGMDLASVSDFTSITALWVKEGYYYFKTWTWIPNLTYENHQNKLLYDRFIEEGSMLISDGNCTDYNRICAKIGEISTISPINAIYTDSWNAQSTMVTLQDMGFAVYPYSQSIGHYNSCTKSMERLIRDGYAVIDRSENVLWQFGNVELKIDHNNNIKPSKANNEKKIDSVISMCTALGGYEESGFSSDFEIFTIG